MGKSSCFTVQFAYSLLAIAFAVLDCEHIDRVSVRYHAFPKWKEGSFQMGGPALQSSGTAAFNGTAVYISAI